MLLSNARHHPLPDVMAMTSSCCCSRATGGRERGSVGAWRNPAHRCMQGAAPGAHLYAPWRSGDAGPGRRMWPRSAHVERKLVRRGLGVWATFWVLAYLAAPPCTKYQRTGCLNASKSRCRICSKVTVGLVYF